MVGKADGSLIVLQNSLASFIEMNRFAASVLLLTLLLPVPSLATPPSQRSQQRDLPPSEIARIAIRSVVVIEAQQVLGTAYGSGFFVRDDLVATNYHVVKDSFEISARLVGRDARYACAVVGKDEENDLAILEVQGLRGYALGLALIPVQVGQEIYVLSNPEEYEGTFTRGMVNAYRGPDMQIDAPLSHGSSGGPVLNKRAQVVAMVRASETAGQNLNFAIPVAHLSRLLSFASPTSATPRSRRAVSRTSPMEAKVESVYREQGLDGMLDWYEKYVEYMDPEDVKGAQKVLRRARASIIKHPKVLKGTIAEKQALKERLNRDIKTVRSRKKRA